MIQHVNIMYKLYQDKDLANDKETSSGYSQVMWSTLKNELRLPNNNYDS